MVGLAESWSVAEWYYNPPRTISSLVFAVIHLVAIFCVLLNAKFGCFIVIVASIFFSISQSSDSGPSQIWGILISLGIAAYEFKAVISFFLLLSLIVCQIFVTLNYNIGQYSYMTLASLSSFFVVSYLLGKSISWKNIANKRQEEEKMLNLKKAEDVRRRRIAVTIHDGMSGSLSLATRELQRLIRKTPSEVERIELVKVNGYVGEALMGMKYALDCLDGDVDFPDIKNMNDLKLLIADEDARLKRLGYKGSWDCEGTCFFNSYIGYVVVSFVRECYANILKHSLPGCVYHIRVSVLSGNMNIECSNKIDKGHDAIKHSQDGFFSSGYGLSLQKANISSIGGSCVYGIYNDEWKAIASIPLRI